MLRGSTLFLAQAYDPQHANQAAVVAWVEGFRRHCEREVLVLAGSGGHAVGDGRVRSFGGGGRPRRMWRFVREYSALYRKYRFRRVFVYMDQGALFVAGALKLLHGSRLYLWRAHPYISPAHRFMVRHVVDRAYSSSPLAIAVQSDRIRIVGAGVDAARFNRVPVPYRWDFVYVGRIAPQRRIEDHIDVIDKLRARGIDATLALIGDAYLPRDRDYAAAMRRSVTARGLDERIVFLGAIVNADLPAYYSAARFTLNISDSAVDRSVLEAMHCGTPPLSNNVILASFLGDRIEPGLVEAGASTDRIAELAAALCRLTPEAHQALSARIASLAKAELSLDPLIERICRDIAANEAGSPC